MATVGSTWCKLKETVTINGNYNVNSLSSLNHSVVTPVWAGEINFFACV